MLSNLTTFSRVLIVLAVVGLVGGGLYYSGILDEGKPTQDNSAAVTGATTTVTPDVIDIGIVDWPGYSGGYLMNDGFEPSTNSRMYREYGLLVRFHRLNEFNPSRNAWMSGEVDLLWMTVEAFPTEVNGIRNFQPRFLFQADWSYGGDVLVAVGDILTVKDLRHRKIAVALGTPSHSFLLWTLKSNNMTVNDVDIVPVASAIDAATAFASGQVDAAVVWSPDDLSCIKAQQRRNAHELTSSKDAPFIIADGFYAKKEYIDSHLGMLTKLVEAWLVGNAEINSNPSAKERAAQICHENMYNPNLTLDDWRKLLDKVRLCTFQDNLNFFGMNPGYSGVTGKDLYVNTGELYRQIGMVEGTLPDWREVIDTRPLQHIKLTGPMHEAWKLGKFAKTQEQLATAQEFATKSVSVVFATGSAELDYNAKAIIDREAQEFKLFAKFGISIEGNTDNTGSYETNQRLSELRAESVADYLVQYHGIDRARIRIRGNAWNNPIATNDTPEGRTRNRRTDFKLLR